MRKKKTNLQTLLETFIPFTILVCGLTLLFLKIGGWSIILGIPMVVIGVVFLIYSYDSLVAGNDEDY